MAHGGGTCPHPHHQTPGGAAAGTERWASAVPRGFQHSGLPQSTTQGRGGGEAALGVSALWPRARVPRLGGAPQPCG